MSRGGAREGAGKKHSGDPCKKLSIAPRMSEYFVIKDAAEKSGKSFSRFCVDAAMEKAQSFTSLPSCPRI